ncbi:MAG: serine/threonine-protein kinase [Isosphaeraceae bacterium]
MFEWLFGAKDRKPSGGAGGGKVHSARAKVPAKPKAAPPPKLRKVNIDRKYTIIAEIGQGSMSRVFRAVENEAGRVVCLKLQDKEKTQAALTRTQSIGRPTEGEMAQQINHPHVVRTYDYGLTNKGEYFLVMDFIEGVSLNFVRQSGADLGRKVELLAQAAEGLAAVHAKGFIHHDYGPKNLLVNRDDQIKLIDFGLAVPNTEVFRRPGNRTGTLQYMAPELVRRETISEKIDIFSWSVTAFELLTGKLPYDATDPMQMIRQRINLDPMDIKSLGPYLPDDLCEIIRKAMARRPEQRWPAAASLPGALRALPCAQDFQKSRPKDRPYD